MSCGISLVPEALPRSMKTFSVWAGQKLLGSTLLKVLRSNWEQGQNLRLKKMRISHVYTGPETWERGSQWLVCHRNFPIPENTHPGAACRYCTQVHEIAPQYFPSVEADKIVFISGRIPLENNTSSDLKVLLKGAQSRNVRTHLLCFVGTCATISPKRLRLKRLHLLWSNARASTN